MKINVLFVIPYHWQDFIITKVVANVHHAVKVPTGQLLSEYALVLTAGLIMAVPVFITGRVLSPAMGDWCLIGQIPVSAVVYAIALSCLMPRRVKEMAALALRLLPAKLHAT